MVPLDAYYFGVVLLLPVRPARREAQEEADA